MVCAASSTEIYDSEHQCSWMPSFTLPPSGAERFTIRHHFAVEPLGMTPKGLASTGAGGLDCLSDMHPVLVDLPCIHIALEEVGEGLIVAILYFTLP